ncbi:increased DNA methylation 3 isoform X2 [Raphanus sativus]|uniref:Increased DNA methylation 3 isoform X2 n=1 Tax=Raphanus sativus TaxID=3726 RepID=A0A9W3C686_RAPSA|nr:increased DNA methylation 3 isoform X2 [Raphanus sativus]
MSFSPALPSKALLGHPLVLSTLVRAKLPTSSESLSLAFIKIQIKCEIQREGRVCIQGVVPEIAIPSDSSGCLYRMQVQQLCPPGPFSITFNLPGQVDPRLFSPKFRPDGIFEVVVVKLGVRVPAS